MSFRTTLLAASILALPLAANAAPPIDGLYLGAGVGANFMQDEHVTVSVPAVGLSIPGTAKLNTGWAGVLSLGWGFGNGFRAEIEGNYRLNSVKAIGISETKYGAMVNALYDFNGVAPWVVPYVGAGVGYQAEYLPAVTQSVGGVTFTRNGATKGSFAYQGIAGAAFPIASVPGLAVTTEYRFLGLAGDRTLSGVATGSGVSLPFNLKSTDNYNHSLLLGIRYAFGAPAMASTATQTTQAPAAAMARSYLVFFDWDKSNLSDRAKGIIKDAAANSAKVAYTKIDVNGNADTSGTPQYNKGLSMRRAQAVAAELVKDGVSKAAIAITASGDTHLLVPTGAGVREPQNRRVEIVIR